jgi:TetR/AcrR family transcriptional regulator, cholesterol catabolism regulator
MPTSASRPSTPARRGRPRVINERSDVRAAAVALFAEQGYRATGVRDIADALGIGATSIYSHIKSKSELLHEILIDTLDAGLAVQQDAIASSSDVVEQLRRAAESQVRFLVEHPHDAVITTRDFRWAEGDALTAIHERRRRYRKVFEDLLIEGANQGRMSVPNAKITAFAIIEMAEGVPRWFRPRGEVSINQLAYLYGEYALRIAGVYNMAHANKPSRTADAGPRSHR